MAEERKLDLEGGRALNKGNLDFKYTPIFQELVNAERLYYKLLTEFKRSSVYAVHAICKRNPTPLNLHNLLGDGGEKYIVGGIFLRRAQGWTVGGQQFSRLEVHDELDTLG